MEGLMALLVVLVAGAALFGLIWWLERFTRRPGLAALAGGFLLLFATALTLSAGDRLLPVVFGFQAILAFWQAWDRMRRNRVPAEDER